MCTLSYARNDELTLRSHKGMQNASYRGMLAVTTAMALASTRYELCLLRVNFEELTHVVTDSYWGISLALVIKNLRDILINYPTLSISDRFDAANANVLKLYIAEVYLPMVNVRYRWSLREKVD